MWIGYGSPGKVDRVHPVIGEVSLQPLHPPAVRGQAVLAEQVLADAQDVGRIEQRLVLGGDEIECGGTLEAFLDGDLFEVARLVGRPGEPGARRLLPAKLRILVEVALHERVVGEVLPVAAAKRHRGGEDLLADGQQHVARGHAAERGAGHEVRRDHRLVPLDGGRAIDANSARLEHRHEVFEFGVGLLHRFERARTPHPAHVAVLGDLRLGGGLGRRNAGEVGAADDEVLQRIEIVPRADEGLAHPRCPSCRNALRCRDEARVCPKTPPREHAEPPVPDANAIPARYDTHPRTAWTQRGWQR